MRDKALRLRKRLPRLFRGHFGARAGFVVGNGFQVVRVRQKYADFGDERRAILRQTLKFRVDAFVCFDGSASLLGNEGLRRVEPCQIGRAARRVVEANAQHGLGFLKQLLRLGEKLRRFRRHKSRPSRRISRINGDRSA